MTSYKSEVPTNLSLSLFNLLDWLTEFRETFTYTDQFIIKDIEEPPDEEVPRAEFGSTPCTLASFSMELRLPLSHLVDLLTNPEVHQILLTQSFYRTLISSTTPFPGINESG